METCKTLCIELTLFASVALLWPVEVSAIDNNGKYEMVGAKKGSCGVYVRERTRKSAAGTKAG